MTRSSWPLAGIGLILILTAQLIEGCASSPDPSNTSWRVKSAGCLEQFAPTGQRLPSMCGATVARTF